MKAEELFVSGQFEEALEAVKNDVRQDAAAVRPRVFLFQMLCVQGQWDRALTQLNIVGDLDKSALPMVQTYREALRCEALRGQVFAGKRSPLIFGEPEPWIAGLLEALQRTAMGEHDAASSLRHQALESSAATTGEIDGNPFNWIADADPRLGPLLEAIVNGRYYWIPYSRIRKIQFEAPADLRDMVWTPAEFTWANGGQTVGLIPTRYPGSESSEDHLVQLARKTDWIEVSSDTQLGIGQRLLATDTQDYALMDVREIQLAVTDDTVSSAGADDSVDG